MSRPLRLAIGLLVLLLPAFFGWHFRNPAIIPILGALYVPLYFLGKTGAWQAMRRTGAGNALLKAAPVTFGVQTVLVGACYLIGLGLGTLFAETEMAPALGAWDGAIIAGFAVLALPACVFVAYAERQPAPPLPVPAVGPGGRTTYAAPPVVTAQADADFAVDPRRVTPETFYASAHPGRPDAAGTALTKILDHKGEKPKRLPLRASNRMIAQAEDRLGVTLPETLRAIYRIQNGGSLPTYYVPREQGAPPTYEHWITAFADDYNSLDPLDRLQILQDDYDLHFDPEYGREEDKQNWIPGADKLVILVARTGYGTALDYRSGPEPGVLLFDHEKGPGKLELMTFDSFDSFLAALREVVSDVRRTDPAHIKTAFGAPPDALDADGFWLSGNPGAGATEQSWRDAGAALGVTLPAALYPFYQAANGGTTKYAVALPDPDGGEPVRVFPAGSCISASVLLRLEHFVSLATLSDRLDFVDDRPPWSTLFAEPHKLIVISAAFDKATLLDYRAGGEPAVLVVPDLDSPDSAIPFASMEDFLQRLRCFGIERFAVRDGTGDPRISARRADAATFWRGGQDRAPVSEGAVAAFVEKWGLANHGLPGPLTSIYAVQNGGLVRFRHAPPQGNYPHGRANSDASTETWQDVFPDGLLPMENWQHFSDWREAHGLALTQSLYDFAERIDPPCKNDTHRIKLDLFVIGDHASQGARMITLLDLSTGSFARNRNILTLRHDVASDSFGTVFGPIMIDHMSAGLLDTVRAHKSDL